MDFGPGRRKRLAIVVCVVLALSGLVLWQAGRAATDPSSRATIKSSSPTPQNSDLTPGPGPDLRRIFSLNVTWLDAPLDYNLFVHSNGAIYRIDAKTGRTIQTTIPQFDNDLATLLPTREGVMVHPTGNSPFGSSTVYVVPDWEPIHTFQARNFELLPGPDPGHVWIRQDPRHLVLVSLDGSPTRTTLRLPEAIAGNPEPDGHGYAIVQSHKKIYDIRPNRTTRLATGRLVATGPSRLLVANCSRTPTCRAVVLGSDFKPIRTLKLDPRMLAFAGYGVISPDGHHAAIAAPDNSADNPITLLDLTTGTSRRLFATVDWQIQVPGSGQLVFTPDGRWLLAIDYGGNLTAVDTSCTPADNTCVSSRTLWGLHSVEQVAVRP